MTKLRLLRPVAIALTCVGLVAVSPAGAASPGTGPSEVAVQAVGALAAARRGYVAFHRHLITKEFGPGHNVTVDADAGWLRDDGRLVSIRIYRQTKNGKPASDAELASLQAGVDKTPPGDDYVLPLTRAGMADYTFDSAPCPKCPSSQVAISFSSKKRDGDHGDGTIVVDGASHQFVRLDFVPSVFPPHVDSATMVMAFGVVLPGGAVDLVSVKQHYTGHMFFLHGGADITTLMGNYRRFASRDEGMKALAAGV